METMLTSQGELRQRFGALTSNTNEIPKCIQTYFFLVKMQQNTE